MIDSFAKKYAHIIAESLPEKDFEEDRLEYGIKFIITNLIPLVILIVYGILTNSLTDIMFAILGFCILRMVSGGYHIKTPELCIFLSVFLIFIVSEFSYLVSDYLIYLNIISFLLVSIFAPSNIREQTLIPKKYDILLKLISLVLVVLSTLINNEIITVSMFVQSLTLIRLGKGGEVS